MVYNVKIGVISTAEYVHFRSFGVFHTESNIEVWLIQDAIDSVVHISV